MRCEGRVLYDRTCAQPPHGNNANTHTIRGEDRLDQDEDTLQTPIRQALLLLVYHIATDSPVDS